MPIHDWYENIAKAEWQEAALLQGAEQEQILAGDNGKGMNFGKGADFAKGESKGKAFGKGKGDNKGKGEVQETQRGGWLKKMVQLAMKVKAEDWTACTILVESYESSSDVFGGALASELRKQERTSG